MASPKTGRAEQRKQSQPELKPVTKLDFALAWEGFEFILACDPQPIAAPDLLWIRKISGPPELGFYRYSGSVPKAWEPIFGTAGSPNARLWNGMMFHPGITAPPGTNALTATFELFLASIYDPPRKIDQWNPSLAR